MRLWLWSHFCKPYGPRSDWSSGSSLIMVHTVYLYAKIGLKSLQEYSADDINRRHSQMQLQIRKHSYLAYQCLRMSVAIIWAETWGNIPSNMCDQWMLKLTWALAQSVWSTDQTDCANAQAVHMKNVCILDYPKCAQGRFWSDCADAQSDLNLRWAQMSEGTFSDVSAHVYRPRHMGLSLMPRYDVESQKLGVP